MQSRCEQGIRFPLTITSILPIVVLFSVACPVSFSHPHPYVPSISQAQDTTTRQYSRRTAAQDSAYSERNNPKEYSLPREDLDTSEHREEKSLSATGKLEQSETHTRRYSSTNVGPRPLPSPKETPLSFVELELLENDQGESPGTIISPELPKPSPQQSPVSVTVPNQFRLRLIVSPSPQVDMEVPEPSFSEGFATGPSNPGIALFRDPEESPSSNVPTIFGATFLFAKVPERLGPRLGVVGLETPAFKKQCKKCCRRTRRTFANTLPFLQGCSYCDLSQNVQPGETKDCAKDDNLGFSGSPGDCFFERCHRILLASTGNCACYRPN